MSPDIYLGSLALCATWSPQGRLSPMMRAWLRGVARRVPVAVPPNLVIDLGRLLTERSPRFLAEPTGTHPPLQSAWRSYREHVVGRLRGASARSALIDATWAAGSQPAGLALGPAAPGSPPAETDSHRAGPSSRAALAVVVLVGRVVERLELREPPLDLAGLRRVIELPDEELRARVKTSLEQNRDDVADVLTAVTRAAKRQAALLTAADAFVVRHLEALHQPSDRVAFAQLSDAAHMLNREVPRQIPRARRHSGSRVTRVEEDTAYPVGGYSAIATHGPIENLVSSELAFLEPDDPLDLFDLRYVTGELLKYTRDEGVWLRANRQIDVVVHAALTELQVKVPTLPFQLSVMAQAALLVLVARLRAWLGADGLRIRIWGPRDHLLTLALAEDVELGVVEIREGLPSGSDAERVDLGGTPHDGPTLVVHPSGQCLFSLSPSSVIYPPQVPPSVHTWGVALGRLLEVLV